MNKANKAYRNYLSFGFNCELSFALEHLKVFQPTLFSWADVSGTDALLCGINKPEDLLSKGVKNYSSNKIIQYKVKVINYQ